MKQRHRSTRRRDNLEILLKRYDNKQSLLAQATGESRSYINQILRGTRNAGDTFCKKIEEKLSLGEFWFDKDHSAEVNGDIHNIETIIPVIPFSKAEQYVQNFELSSMEYYTVSIPSGDFSDRSFGVRVEGGAMAGKLNDGMTAVVDPMKKPKHGSVVLIKENDTSSPIFRTLEIDGSRKIFTPTDTSRFQVINAPDISVLGVVVRAITEDFIY